MTRRHQPLEAMRFRGRPPLAYQNQVRFLPTRAIDADTIEGLAWFPAHVSVPLLELDYTHEVPMEIAVRLEGINAPEKGTTEGEAATDFVRGWMGWAGSIWLATDGKKEKYGRWLGDLRWGDPQDSLAAELYMQGMAVLYPPPPRPPDPAALLP